MRVEVRLKFGGGCCPSSLRIRCPVFTSPTDTCATIVAGYSSYVPCLRSATEEEVAACRGGRHRDGAGNQTRWHSFGEQARLGRTPSTHTLLPHIRTRTAAIIPSGPRRRLDDTGRQRWRRGRFGGEGEIRGLGEDVRWCRDARQIRVCPAGLGGLAFASRVGE